MKINNKDMEQTFNCNIVSFSPSTMEYEGDVYFPDNSYTPVLINNILKPQKRSLVIDFVCELDISMFAREVINPYIIDFEDGFLYDCTLVSKDEQDDGCGTSYTCTYEMYSIKRKSLVTQQVNSFAVEGSYTCACEYEITSTKDLSEFVVDGYTIKNLKANRTFILDGIYKLVYYKDTPSKSAFDDLKDITTFPKLEIGNHTIVKSDSTVKVVVKYYPIYL